MKLVFVFILAGFLSVNATETYSQNVRFDLKMENVSFKSILNKIEEKTDFNFIYQNDEIENMSKLSIDVDNSTVPEILDRLLKDKGLEYKIYEHYVLIQKKGVETTGSNFAQQQKTVSGKVTDSEGQALPGVTIVIKGTTQGVITDINGKYTFSNIPANATLQFSFVGMKNQEIAVGNKTIINVQMKVDAIGLDEVVAIGYGTAKKKDLSGSIVNVNIKELEKYKPANVQEFLRSSVSGLRIGYSTSAKNSPSLEIRGDNTIKSDGDDETTANSPLIVLDGVIFNGDLAEININDIESVDVLKDASAAAIYGSRSSNGVIVFNTKKGDMGAPVVRVNVKYGIVTAANRLSSHKAGDDVMGWLTDMNEAINDLSGASFSVYDNYYDLADEYKSDWLSEKGISGETDPTAITSAWIDGFGFDETEKENFLAGRSFDWQDFLFHIGLKQDYNVSFSGRTNKVSYYWSLGYIENESTQMNEKFTTLTSRVNLDVMPAEWLNVGLNCNFAFQDEGDVPISNSNYYEYSPYDSPWKNEVWYGDSQTNI